ncbi:hypothetical protein GE09DRAFT_586324 [Coniochaeta sp. 2T2.1]|nr:hypothetical protein GE09DRAFT_586324 [Coniochaeta sp. 2T2.1]
MFVSVVIDGDSLLFLDELVTQGMEGGKQAVVLLHQAIEEDLKLSLPDNSDLPVIIRVYANVRGLSKTYKEHGILSELKFDEFIRGFNIVYPMCDYIDAGNGKDCADVKVKGQFDHFLHNVHCQKIFLGGPADDGYARPLTACSLDEPARQRITLLEGSPFALELALMRNKFHTVFFQKVFRTQKLPATVRRVPVHITPPATPSVGYASAASKGLLSSTTPPPAALPAPRAAVPTTPPTWRVLRNVHGQRIDERLDFTWDDYNSMKASKLCNNFHLLGNCPFPSSGPRRCTHNHGERLSPKQMTALRAVARLSPCPSGLNCGAPDCIFGHRCVRHNCVTGDCWFDKSMHGVDTGIVD